MDDHDKVRRAQRVEPFLKGADWEEAWAAFRLEVFRQIENAKTDEGTLRGKSMLGIASDVRRILENMVKEGAMAAHQIQLEEERKKRPFWS